MQRNYYQQIGHSQRDQRIRPNKFAASALLARVYLYINDWTNAQTEATAVLDNDQFDLQTDIDDVFIKK